MNTLGFISHGCNPVSMVAVTTGLNGRFSRHKGWEGDAVNHLDVKQLQGIRPVYFENKFHKPSAVCEKKKKKVILVLPFYGHFYWFIFLLFVPNTSFPAMLFKESLGPISV